MLRALALIPSLVIAALAPAAVAAPGSASFTITGSEYAFTSTVGAFAGRAAGNAGDIGFWNATVRHDRLGGVSPIYVNGGSFEMTVRPPGGGIDAVAGTLTHHGGTITTLKPGANCTNQQYRVAARLQDVLTPNSAGGSGSLKVTLTHYRLRVLGHCLAVKARVAGTVTFHYLAF
jgi:hypothetical protein